MRRLDEPCSPRHAEREPWVALPHRRHPAASSTAATDLHFHQTRTAPSTARGPTSHPGHTPIAAHVPQPPPPGSTPDGPHVTGRHAVRISAADSCCVRRMLLLWSSMLRMIDDRRRLRHESDSIHQYQGLRSALSIPDDGLIDYAELDIIDALERVRQTSTHTVDLSISSLRRRCLSASTAWYSSYSFLCSAGSYSFHQSRFAS